MPLPLFSGLSVCLAKPPVGSLTDNSGIPPAINLAIRKAQPFQYLGSVLSQGHTLAIRLDAIDGTPVVETASNRADAQKILNAQFRDARDVAVVSRIATDWYVFAEYVAELDGGNLRRFAAIHPIENGELTGTFGYGRDEAAAV